MYRVGIDIGSVSVNLVVMDQAKGLVESRYVRHKGRPLEVAREILAEVTGKGEVEFIAATGTGAKMLAQAVGATFINEIVAISRAFTHSYPHVGSIIDIGGEDSKLIILEKKGKEGKLRVKDFSMNALCAAGTGSFLDQQASRLRFTIEEFSEVALRSENPPRIAGRCTVFAKSDMIHLQQIATPDYEIVAGLCYALARNFKGNIAKGKEVRNPIAFIGGVAANAGMRKAIMDVFKVQGDDFFVPEHYTSMGAMGAVYTALDEPARRRKYKGLEELDRYIAEEKGEEFHESLQLSDGNLEVSYEMREVKEKTRAYLGVDVGSISTNLVLLDEEDNVLAKRYLMTEGRPLEAVKKGLGEIGDEIGGMVEILGAGTTGSGRYLTADFIGADIVRNEITAQAEAAIMIDPEVDTIFEIGGQDSKYISVDNGVIVDFEMNKACAAGTGSFLEEQAERLGISIKGEFGRLALGSEKPVKMGERCTVFIESDLMHHQQRGAKTDDLVSGLAYSIVTNYLNKVVGDRRVGERIFFQGGTAFNKGVVAAFEKVVNRPIRVPPHHDVTGAIGVAILAKKEKDWEKSGFKGFDLSKRKYDIDTFECKGCENLCEIRKVTVEQESPLYYGSRCEKYDVVRRANKSDARDYVKLRDELLTGTYDKEVQGEVIGIPKILSFHELLPFWKAFFGELGFTVVLSDPTNKKTIREGVESIIVEACFPIKVTHGHILNLINRGVKRLFIPSVLNLGKMSEDGPDTHACPYAQSIPYTVRASIDFEAAGVRVDSPVIYFGRGRETTLKNLLAYGKDLKRSGKEIRKAFTAAMAAQESYYRKISEAGLDFLSSLKAGEKGMVIIGRPYNSLDPGINLNIHKKLMELGVKPIPMDMLPLVAGIERDAVLDSMYWGYGQKILRTAKLIAKNPNLYGIYITNFGCGPDSFVTHFFKRAIGNRPFLQLEIDEHSADAGAVTRLEAFLDSIKNAKAPKKQIAKEAASRFEVGNGSKRKIYIPYMSDHSRALAAAFRGCGVDADVFEESDEETVRWGRKNTSGKECYPCALTTGDMLKLATKEGADPSKIAFFMPSGNGPCRFGQYHRFHRLVLDEKGFENIPIYAPNQDHRLYNDLNIMGGKFSRLGWRAIVATDMLTKLLHETRPLEEEKGATDRVYSHALKAVCDSVEKGGEDVFHVLEGQIPAFLDIEKTKSKKPIVGIVGEIYVRSNNFSNGNLVRNIEDFGGIAWLAPIQEWISYLNFVSQKLNVEENGLKEMFNFMITNFVQARDEHHLEKPFMPYLKYGSEPKVKEIIGKANSYIDVSFEGEAILSVGKAIDFIEKGVSGIVNAIPFTCMPGTIAAAVLKLVQNKYDVPIINIAYDGQGATNISTRLEAFMYQVKEYYETNNG